MAYVAVVQSLLLPQSPLCLTAFCILFIPLSTITSIRLAQRSGLSICKSIVLLPLIPFFIVIGFVSIMGFFAMVIVLFWPFSAIKHRRRERQLVRRMRARGRYIPFRDLQHRLAIGEGTLIEETGHKGPCHIWWTDQDLMALGKPASTKEEILDIITGRAKDGFDSRCLTEYLDEEHGKAILTSIPTKYVTSGRLAGAYPHAKIIKVVRQFAQG